MVFVRPMAIKFEIYRDGSRVTNFSPAGAVCVGPEFRRGPEVKDDVQAIDVCPTVCELLGANARHARGKRLPKLFA